jgi:hypothetical protein
MRDLLLPPGTPQIARVGHFITGFPAAEAAVPVEIRSGKTVTLHW